MSKDAKLCPVCGGRGSVPQSFYSVMPYTGTMTVEPRVTCRACNGRGVIVE